MRRSLVLVWILAGCGGAGVHAEPEAAPPVVSAAPDAPASTGAAPVQVAPSSCFDESAEEVLGCSLVRAPVRPLSEVVAAWNALREQRRPPGRRQRRDVEDELAPRALDAEELALAAELRAERCARALDDPERAAVTYQLARTYYESNLWGPATALFEEVALDDGAGELATFAANLSLDSLNIRMRQVDGEARDDCLARFGERVATYQRRFCRPTIEEEELCGVLARLTEQLARQPAADAP